MCAEPQITPENVISHIRYLASDDLRGRGSGTPGGRMAAEYIARQFEKAGVRPAGTRGSWFQPFPVITGVHVGSGTRLELRPKGGAEIALAVQRDFLPVSFSASSSASGPLVFAGYGISEPRLGRDDYAGLNVRGKIVLVLRHVPGGDLHGPLGSYAALRYKVAAARDHGAAGVLFVTGPATPVEDDLGKLESDGSFADSGIPAALAKRDAVAPLFAASGKSLAAVQAEADKPGEHPFTLGDTSASLAVHLEREVRDTANVAARLEGSDPALKNEWVVIGAHYDHLGMGGPGSLNPSKEPAIHHGADDNASGTAGVIELAKYFAARRERPKRSLLFLCFSGEEMGLLGSAYYVQHPLVPLDHTAAMINMDMIGRERNDTLQVIGTKTSPDWQPILDAVNETAKLHLKGTGSGFGDSDQSSFYGRKVPVLFFFTGVHEDYHRPSDTCDKINAPGEVQVLNFVASTAERIADLPRRPQFARSSEAEPGAGPSFSVYLGTVPDYSDTRTGMALSGVRESSPAERAGLRAGDVLVEFGGHKIGNVYDYTYALQDARPNVPVKVAVLRNGKRVELTVTPAARK